MAKVKKAGGKGKKGKKGKKKHEEVTLITEVDKTFYELQITDLNRKLARLRSLTEELELKNEELRQSNEKLDEDRADIIMFLKRSLQEKSDEINELQDRLKALQEKRQSETDEFLEKIADMQQEYKQMQEQLSSEIKLLTGKLNSLEEFRVQRDELMRKYEVQETAMEEQELRHKREVYNIEKKFIIGKDKLKKEMEERLLQLSTEFQDATNLRIAATTHRVIRENIAINNELDVILETHQRLQTENEKLKNRDRTLRMETELHEAEKKKALSKTKVQYNIIERLTTEHYEQERKLDRYVDMDKTMNRYMFELNENERTMEGLSHKIKILEQNLHASRSERTAVQTELEYSKEEVKRLSQILCESVICINDALVVKSESDQSLAIAQRENLLVTLLSLMSKVHEKKLIKPSMESIDSVAATYAKGDLGFVPKPVVLRSKIPTRKQVESQVGSSFEEFITMQSETVLAERLKDFLGEEEESEVYEQSKGSSHYTVAEEELEEESRVFFDDEPEPPSEASVQLQELDPATMQFSKGDVTAVVADDEKKDDVAEEGDEGEKDTEKGDEKKEEVAAGEGEDNAETGGEPTPETA